MSLTHQKSYWEAVRKYLRTVTDFRGGAGASFELHLMEANGSPSAENYRRLATTCEGKEAALQAELTALRQLAAKARAAAHATA